MKNIVLNCDDDQSFKLANGEILRNLIDLHRSLEKIDDNTFMHHVNEEKNDFSTWVNDTLSEKKLATDLLNTKDKKVMHLLVKKKIVGHFIRTIFYHI